MGKPTTSPGLTVEGYLHYTDSYGKTTSWPLDATGTASTGYTSGMQRIECAATAWTTLWSDANPADFTFMYALSPAGSLKLEFQEDPGTTVAIMPLEPGIPFMLGSDDTYESQDQATGAAVFDRIRVYNAAATATTVYLLLAE